MVHDISRVDGKKMSWNPGGRKGKGNGHPAVSSLSLACSHWTALLSLLVRRRRIRGFRACAPSGEFHNHSTVMTTLDTAARLGQLARQVRSLKLAWRGNTLGTRQRTTIFQLQTYPVTGDIADKRSLGVICIPGASMQSHHNWVPF